MAGSRERGWGCTHIVFDSSGALLTGTCSRPWNVTSPHSLQLTQPASDSEKLFKNEFSCKISLTTFRCKFCQARRGSPFL